MTVEWGTSVFQPGRDLGPIKPVLRTWFYEDLVLFDTALEGVAAICKHVARFAPRLEPDVLWNARVTYCDLLFDIIYGWIEGTERVLFARLARPHVTPQPWDSLAAAGRRDSIFYHMGFSVFVPRSRTINWLGRDITSAARQTSSPISGANHDGNSRSATWHARSAEMLVIDLDDFDDEHLYATIVGGIVSSATGWKAAPDSHRVKLYPDDLVLQRVFLPQHVPRSSKRCFDFPDETRFKQEYSMATCQEDWIASPIQLIGMMDIGIMDGFIRQGVQTTCIGERDHRTRTGVIQERNGQSLSSLDLYEDRNDDATARGSGFPVLAFGVGCGVQTGSSQVAH